ncbi:MAG: GntR family transcriptional regulator [Xanthobacteraceae bacterium]
MKTKPRRRRPSPGRAATGDGRRTTGAQRVYAALRHAIIVLDIQPGTALEEERLCRQYKVSRTPLREALIRLASEGLVELEPNRGAKVATVQFVDVLDHYEAMDVFQPVIWHFAAVRRTGADIEAIKKCLKAFRTAITRQDAEAIIQSNYEIHTMIASACHNRSLERAARHMLVDKLRVAQHAVRDLERERGHILAVRFAGALRILMQAVDAIVAADANGAEELARRYNVHVRKEITDILSASLAPAIKVRPPFAR